MWDLPLPDFALSAMAAASASRADLRDVFTGSALRRLSTATALALPLLVVAAGTSPYLGFAVPATVDVHDESYQPVKTLRFFHRRGADVHKWGTLPNLLYAPAFGAMLGYWHLTGALAEPSDDYPYGFARPHEQIGAMIVVARAIVLATGLLATLALLFTMVSVTRLPVLSAAGLSAVFASSPGVLHALGSTKPDGLMVGFLALSMACYLWILFRGFTTRAGVCFSLLAIAAISCKELAAPAYVLPYAGLLLDGLRRSAGRTTDRVAFLRAYVLAVVAAFLGYAVINVAYAPAAWLSRMDLVFFGPLKDPDIWGRPRLATYSYEAAASIVRCLGYGGSLLLLGTALASLVRPDRRVALAWLPLVGFVVIVFATAGYMPTRFMLPVSVLAAIPTAAVLAVYGATPPRSLRRRGIRRAGTLLVSSLIVFECVTGVTASWADLRLNEESLMEHHLAGLATHATVYPVTLYPRNPGSSRLSYLGYDVDDRALWELASGETTDLPRFVLTSRAGLAFFEGFHAYPERAAYWKDGMGFDYRRFSGFEALGYAVADVAQPELGWLDVSAFQPYLAERLRGADVLIYERQAASR